MKRNLKISVSKKPDPGGLVSCRSISLREKLLTKLLGGKQKLMVLVPGESVAAVTISDDPEGGGGDE